MSSALNTSMDVMPSPGLGLKTMPLDIIECILDQIDPPSLFSTCHTLLTVNSIIAPLAARRLYQSPFDVILRYHGTAAKREALHDLCVLILHASPSRYPNVEALRQQYSACLESFTQPPAMDYLSFITTMNFAQVNNKTQLHWWYEELKVMDLYMLDSIVWAACSHRLPSVQSMSLLSLNLPYYDARAHFLANLRTLDIVLVTENHQCEPKPSLPLQIEFATDFVRRIRDPGVFPGTWGRHPPVIRLDCLNGPKQWWSLPGNSEALSEFYALLPVARPQCLMPVQENHFREWIHFYHTVDTVCVDHLHALLTWGEPDVEDDIFYISLPFPRINKAEFLKRCRQLRYLGIEIEDQAEERVLEWLAEEARALAVSPFPNDLLHRKHASSHHDGNGHYHYYYGQKPNRVHLEKLDLAVANMKAFEIERPLTDAVFACRTTLRDISVHAWDCTARLSIFQHMPGLESLTLCLSSILCADEGLVGVPNLKRLALCDQDFGEDLDDEFIDAGGWMLDDPAQPWALPGLVELRLQGVISFRYHQASFKLMPNLKQVELISDYPEQVCPWTGYQIHRQYWQSFPMLQCLVLDGEQALGFRWSMLRGQTMPQLHQLTLKAPPNDSNGVFPFRDILDLQFPRPSTEVASFIKILELRHWWMPNQVMSELPFLTPALEKVVVEIQAMPNSIAWSQVVFGWRYLRQSTLIVQGVKVFDATHQSRTQGPNPLDLL